MKAFILAILLAWAWVPVTYAQREGCALSVIQAMMNAYCGGSSDCPSEDAGTPPAFRLERAHRELTEISRGRFILERQANVRDASQEIQDMLGRMHDLSRTADGVREVGTFVVHLKDGSTRIEYFTSDDPHSIAGTEVRRGMERALARVNPEDVARAQVWHTHPSDHPDANRLSPEDIDYTGTVSRGLGSLGIHVPVDMIAAPTQLRDEGTLYMYTEHPRR